jgi:hypothetical protein
MKKKQTKINTNKNAVKKKSVSKTATKKKKTDSYCSDSCNQNSNKFVLWWKTFKEYFKI